MPFLQNIGGIEYENASYTQTCIGSSTCRDNIKYMEGQGVNLYSVSLQNEPDYAADWTYWTASDLASFAAQYGKAVTNGTNAKLMSPESFQYRKDLYNSLLNNAQAKANIDAYGTHFYGTQRSQMDFSALENSGKEIWSMCRTPIPIPQTAGRKVFMLP